MGTPINCKELSENILNKIAEERIKYNADKVVLTVLSVGDDPASAIYVRNKKRACEKVGFVFNHITLDRSAGFYQISEAIDKAADKSSGVILQLPLISDHLKKGDEEKLIEKVEWLLDVDGFSYNSRLAIYDGFSSVGSHNLVRPPHLPCTPKGILEILNSIPGFSYIGKTALVIGRSNIVGKPIANMLMDKGCTVTIVHSKTNPEDLQRYADEADIIVSAVGKTNILTVINSKRKNKPIIIDVGMNRNTEGKLCGDLSEELKANSSSYYTTVPGGVGPMTVAELIQNTWDSWKWRNGKSEWYYN